MNLKKGLLLLFILFIGVGIVSASDVTEDTIDDTTTTTEVEENIQYTSNDYNIEEDNNLDNNNNEEQNNGSITVTNSNYDSVMSSLSTYDTVTFDDTFTGKTMNINSPVTITATNTAKFTDSQITITSNGVTISNLNIENNNIEGSVITATNVNNITLNLNNITTTNTNNSQKAIGITFNNVNNSYITNSNITVSGYPQTMGWENSTGVWLSESQVTGIYMIQVNNVNVINNIITVTNSSLPVNNFTTIEGITLKTNSNNVNITDNSLYLNGSNYVYAISLSNVVNYVNISNNGILMSSNNYLNGIQLDKTNHTTVYNNTIMGYSNVESEYIPSFERVAYGIVVTTSNYMATSSESVNNTISSNSIILEAPIVYAIELYLTDNNTLENNEIDIVGNITIGIGLYNSSNNDIYGNIIEIESHNKTVSAYFYEQITPTSTGIIIVGNESSTNNIMNYNEIYIEDYNNNRNDDLYCIIIRATGNTVTYNILISDDINEIHGGDECVDKDNGNTVNNNYP